MLALQPPNAGVNIHMAYFKPNHAATIRAGRAYVRLMGP